VAGDLAANTATGNLTVNATTGTNAISTGSGNDTITGGAQDDIISLGAFVDSNTVVVGTVATAGTDTVSGFVGGAAGDVDFFKFASTGTNVYTNAGAVGGATITDAQIAALAIAGPDWDEAGDAIGFSWSGNNYAMIHGNYIGGGFSNGTDAMVIIGVTDLTTLNAANFIA
jgi:hypothetical protein